MTTDSMTTTTKWILSRRYLDKRIPMSDNNPIGFIYFDNSNNGKIEPSMARIDNNEKKKSKSK